jgi:hypothetical protein
MLIGTLNIKNTTNKVFNIFQGPKHKTYRGLIGPNSFAGWAVNDTTGKTYFRAVPHDGGGPIDFSIPADNNHTQVTWVI